MSPANSHDGTAHEHQERHLSTMKTNKPTVRSTTTLEVPAYLSQYQKYHLIEDTVFNFNRFLPSASTASPQCGIIDYSNDSHRSMARLSEVPLKEIIKNQNWVSNSSDYDRNVAHLLTCEIVLATIENAAFDDIFQPLLQPQVQQKMIVDHSNHVSTYGISQNSNEGNIKMLEALEVNNADIYTSKDGKNSIRSDSAAGIGHSSSEEHILENPNPKFISRNEDYDTKLLLLTEDEDDDDTRDRSNAIAVLQEDSDDSFILCGDHYNVTNSDNNSSRLPVSENIFKVHQRVCPSQLAHVMMETRERNLKNEKLLKTTFKDLGIVLSQQSMGDLLEIEDRCSWIPIIGNENVIELCERPSAQNVSYRDKFIFEVQNLRCAFCGAKTDLRKLSNSSFYFCFYYGRYGCNTCITGQLNIIPAKVLFQWDFKSYPVSNVAKEFLDKTKQVALYRPRLLCPKFLQDSSKMAGLRKIEELRQRISLVMDVFERCNEIDAIRLRNKIKSHFHQTRTHLFYATGEYSLQDFCDISSNRVDNMEHYLNIIFAQTKHHCENCERSCLQKFSSCLLCKDLRPLFPWYCIDNSSNTSLVKCENCLKLYHRKCCKSITVCPRCSYPDFSLSFNRSKRKLSTVPPIATVNISSAPTPSSVC